MGDYIGRFNFKVVTIPSLQQEVAILALMTGLKEGTAFWSCLGGKKLTSLTKVLDKDNDFIKGQGFDKAASCKHSEGDRKEKENEMEKERDISRKDKRQANYDRREVSTQ